MSELLWFDVMSTNSDEPAELVLLSSARGEVVRAELTEDTLRALIGTLIASLRKLDAPAMMKIGKADAFLEPQARVSPIVARRDVLVEVEAIPRLAFAFAWAPATAKRIAADIMQVIRESLPETEN
jgi:hypothetical protein